MKNSLRMIWVAAAATLALGTVALADNAIRMKVNVPFDFIVRDQAMPAGEYVFERDVLPGKLRIVSGDLKNTVVAFYGPASDNKTGLSHALVFNKYGTRHFLKEVWAGDGVIGAQFSPSRREREELARNPGGPQIALLGTR